MNKDLKKLFREAEKQGWRVEKRTKHYMLYAPDGIGKVLCASTPSGQRWLKRTVSQMRRHGFEWRGR